MSCKEHNLAGPISDEAALHLDACPACRARFDGLYAPVALPRPALPRRGPSWTAPLLAAAALLIGLSLSDRPERRAPDLGESMVDGDEVLHIATADEEDSCSLEPEDCPV